MYTANYMYNEPASIRDNVIGHRKRNWYRRATGFSSYEEALAWASEAAWDPFIKDLRITKDVERVNEIISHEEREWLQRHGRGNFRTTDGGMAYRR